MILETRPVPMAEAQALLAAHDSTKPVADYFKTFTPLKEEKATELVAALRGLNNLKLKESHFVKCADFLPRDAEGVHKIVNDISLTEQEVAAILDVVKKY